MIFKPELLQLVLAGTKTQTRRPVHTNDRPLYSPWPDRIDTVKRYGTGKTLMRWQVGRDYAAAPGRGKHAVARIRVLDIRREDVRCISIADVKAEGFERREEFLLVWVNFYDRVARLLTSEIPHGDLYGFYKMLNERPAALYAAWALTFELVKPLE